MANLELPKVTEMGGYPQLTLSANALYVGQVVTSAAAKLPHSIGEFPPASILDDRFHETAHMQHSL